jgi:tripartite-type tricarboxylate transporter receptor subunit TctC
MKLSRLRFLHLAAGAAALPAVSRFAWAQTYPSRPVTIIVPFAPGGPNDTIARIIADRMRGSFSQPIIIENAAWCLGHYWGRPGRARGRGWVYAERR